MELNAITEIIQFIKKDLIRQIRTSDELLNEKTISLVNELEINAELLEHAAADPLVWNNDSSSIYRRIDEIRTLSIRLMSQFNMRENADAVSHLIRLCEDLFSPIFFENKLTKEYTDNLDKQTANHERYIDRIKTETINELRSETSALRELLQDEARQFYEKQNSDFRSSINIYRNELHKESENLVLQLHKQFQSRVEDLNSRLEVTVGERIEHFERRFSQLQTRNTELTTSLTNIDSSISDAVQQSKDKILRDIYSLQDEAHLLRKEMANASSQLTKDIELAGEQAKETVLKSVQSEIAQYKKIRELLNQQVKNAAEIVGTLSKKAMAHEHILQANREFNTFLIHQVLGVVFLLGAVAMSIAIFSNSLGINVPWLNWLVSVQAPAQTMIDPITGKVIATAISSVASEELGGIWFFKRISILILLTAPGIYFLKEAAVHRSKENVYRQRGVQLAAIAPYLNELEPCERQGIKKDLVKTFFSFHDGKADTKNVPDFLRDLKETMKIVSSIDKFGPNNRVRKAKRNIEVS
ncbi:coiled-coil domain-containing protein [Vibrio vulnificus]|uniref:hypothetical protein n=1 Tax=Vibrio vulnificus TaxID=672 RepID=UPI00307DCA53|nr:hypothetical protein [Vibrio vulnificus]EIV8483947.1 hypothetical protein [Vibrio vulnificus]